MGMSCGSRPRPSAGSHEIFGLQQPFALCGKPGAMPMEPSRIARSAQVPLDESGPRAVSRPCGRVRIDGRRPAKSGTSSHNMFRDSKTEGRMTIIQCYRRHGQLIVFPCYLMALLFVIASWFTHARLLQLVFAGVASVLIIGAFIAMTRFSCPRCRKPMGLLSRTPASRRMIGKSVGCRHCGVDVEDPC